MAKFRMFKSFYEVKNIVESSIGRHRTAARLISPRLDTRPLAKKRMERLEVQNCLRMKQHVFVAFLEKNCLKMISAFGICVSEDG